MNQKEIVDYWIDISQYDLKTAYVMLKGKRYLYVGFMCHQAIEKILKAHYVAVMKANPLKIHNLRRIAQDSQLYSELSETQKDFIDMLNPLNIEARYPTYKKQLLKSLNNKKCTELIKQTKEFHKWIKNKLLQV